MVTKYKGQYTWRSKPGSGSSARPLPPDLQAEFEALPWPDDVTLDMEFVGPRMIEHKPQPSLHVFDILSNEPFEIRRKRLYDIVKPLVYNGNWEAFCHSRVKIVPYQRNPGLVQMFEDQLINPLSEGLVIRRADSRIIGHPARCVDNPHVLKVKYRNVRELIGEKRKR